VTSGPVDQRELFIALAAGNVRFVVVGGYAVAAHGYERATRDVDIVFATDLENCERFATVLARLEAEVRLADLPPPGGEITAGWLAGGGHFVFGTVHGLLDALSWIAGRDHAALDSQALTVELSDGSALRVCSYEDLVAMKRLAGRPRDLDDLRELEAVREDQAER
jgi:hypothetical protein